MGRLLDLLSWPDVFWLGPYVFSWGTKSLQAASQKALDLIPEHPRCDKDKVVQPPAPHAQVDAKMPL